MVYSEELEIQNRILDALRDAYPDRFDAMGKQVRRWFTRHWRNDSRDGVPENQRCRICDVERAFGGVTRPGRPAAGVRFPVCTDCVRDAEGMATDERWPSRDMVRNEALRALRAVGQDEAAIFVQEIASGFPDIQREADAHCSVCQKKGPVAKGAKAKICGSCLRDLADDISRALGPF